LTERNFSVDLRIANRLVRTLLPAPLADDLIDDLIEEYHRYVIPERGARRARTWYWRQVVTSIPPSIARLRAQRPRRGNAAMESVLREIRYAVRQLMRSPGVTVPALLTLGLGIGANTMMFSVVHGVLLRPLPFEEPDRLLTLHYASPERARNDAPFSKPNYEDMAARTTTTSGLTAYPALPFSGVVLTGAGEPEELETGYVTDGFFRVLGVTMLHGRGFAPGEDIPGQNAVAVLAEPFWRERFTSDPSVVGQTISLSGAAFTVIGIAPGNVRLPDPATAIWVPLSRITPDRIPHHIRGIFWLSVIARQGPGVPVATVRAEMNTIAAGLRDAHPDTNDRWTEIAVGSLQDNLVGDIRPALLLLLGAVGFVLLIACANVANLLLARATGRAQEMAVRAALGATRRRLVVSGLIESCLLGIFGGTLGLAFAAFGSNLLIALGANQLPRSANINVNGTVLMFTAGISVLTGLLFGMVPALRTASTAAAPHLTSRGAGTGAGSNRLRYGLVVGEIAITVSLVIGAGLLLKSFERLVNVNPGFDPENVLTLSYTYPSYAYEEREDYLDMHRQVLASVRAVPGVVSAGSIQQMPVIALNESTGYNLIEREGDDDDLSALFRAVSPNYFATVRIPLMAGRDVDDRERRGAPYGVVINQAMADLHWPDGNAVGQRISVWDSTAAIVGVVGNVLHGGLGSVPEPTLYAANEQATRSRVVLMVRTAGDPRDMETAVRDAIWAVAPDQPIARIATLSDVVHETIAPYRFTITLIGAFGVLALLLALVGIYGVMSYSVNQRRHELGIRTTLGATGTDLIRMVVRHGLVLSCLGAGAGVLIALALGRSITSLLYQVDRTDPVVFVSAVGTAVIVAMLACVVPAVRATKVDPATVLRSE
jgi:predicted permease